MEFQSKSDLNTAAWDSIISSFLKSGPVSNADTAGSTTKSSAVIVAHHCAVATDDWRCSMIGREVLKSGGNAVDAAVAAALCLGVVSSASSGIGGGAFMLLRLADGTTKAFDMREVCPMLVSEDTYHDNPILKAKGPLSIAVPGELAGLHKVWETYGSLPWETLVAPAAIFADMGFKISPYLYMEMGLEEAGIFEDKGLSEIFTLNGKLLKEGDICYNKKLAETLRTISKEGPKAFYNGQIGENLIKDIQQLGGKMNTFDLTEYKVQMRDPVSTEVFGMTVLGMPPPSAGGVGMTLMLHILAQYGDHLDISSPLGIHRTIEAIKHVYAVRMNIGDPNFDNVSEVVSDMLSLEFAKELKKAINDNKTFGPDHYGGKWREIHDYQKYEYGTSHLSIVDGHGNAVAMTSSVNYHFGSQILSPSTGILLNNQMDDFCMHNKTLYGSNRERPHNNNHIHGGKRPLSSMSPTIILKDGQLKAVIGGSGGTMIIPGVSEVLLNLFVRKLDEKRSIMAPRLYHQLIPNVVHYEDFTSVTGDRFEVAANILKDLKEKGHEIQKIDSGECCQFITLKRLLGSEANEMLTAVSDPRKGGIPSGY